ncbi:antibiotic biosynthesis monooxygenase family protein [Cognatilysobacter lacus]|uniref:Antibiotic biosynthesis monooxygenase n=1 Tax=Cognatilysobacter lacus TaxID=1643323 RepID=A0A5D8Z0M6_9GAMM|nr:antibiotic biosynthesis monooxygenase [Lysobacter lacus]TZF87622.1 antibiotic biosynthesis monooxygenase [Lysobacter lacus]
MIAGFASTPAPPYWMVSFTSARTAVDGDAYAEAAARMLELASIQPGFLGAESVRDSAGLGITLSYWTDEAAIAAWRAHPEHAAVRARGRADWYEHFEVRVAKVERAYSGRADA